MFWQRTTVVLPAAPGSIGNSVGCQEKCTERDSRGGIEPFHVTLELQTGGHGNRLIVSRALGLAGVLQNTRLSVNSWRFYGSRRGTNGGAAFKKTECRACPTGVGRRNRIQTQLTLWL